jgi:hypothetical protein
LHSEAESRSVSERIVPSILNTAAEMRQVGLDKLPRLIHSPDRPGLLHSRRSRGTAQRGIAMMRWFILFLCGCPSSWPGSLEARVFKAGNTRFAGGRARRPTKRGARDDSGLSATVANPRRTGRLDARRRRYRAASNVPAGYRNAREGRKE